MKSFSDTAYHNSPKKALLFLSLIFLWVIGGFIVILILSGSTNDQYRTLYYSLDASKSVIALLQQYFIHADDWNWITLILFLSISVIVFNLNDLYLLRFFARWIDVEKLPGHFYYAGAWWLARLSTNLLISGIQIVLLAYVLNISVGSQRILSISQLSGSYDVVLLGTSKLIAGTNHENQYYRERIGAVKELFNAGKIRSILISGDHQGNNYSEPLDMKRDLLRSGIPANLITLDLTGYRTFDSILKLKRLASVNPFLFVSQEFHLERALFIAGKSGIDAVGFAASGDMNMKMVRREAFAKTKVLLDIYILNTQAFGMPAFPRRKLSVFNGSHLILLSFVLGIVGLAGWLSRNLLTF